MVLWAGSLGLGGCSSRKVSALPAHSGEEQDEGREEEAEEVQEVEEAAGLFLFSGHSQDKEKQRHCWSVSAWTEGLNGTLENLLEMK